MAPLVPKRASAQAAPQVASIADERGVDYFILPSVRVAKMRDVNVREYQRIRGAAIAAAAADGLNQYTLNAWMNKFALPALLVAISAPIEQVYREPFDAEAVAKAIAAEVKDGSPLDPRTLAMQVESARTAAYDRPAMLSSAKFTPLTDFEREQRQGYLGEMDNAMMGDSACLDVFAFEHITQRYITKWALIETDPKVRAAMQTSLASAGT